MENEQQVVRPLMSTEIKDGITAKIAEAVRESLNSTCWLHGPSWAKFKAKWRIDVTLVNMWGEEQSTGVEGKAEGAYDLTLEGEIPYTPPNVFRHETGQSVPTVVNRDDGSSEQKAVVFRQQRKYVADRE